MGPGAERKIALIGGAAKSLLYAPWPDPSWEFWGHASCVLAVPFERMDRLYDPHPPHVFMEGRKNGFKDYYGYLKGCPTPVYMQQQYAAIPQSRRIPYEVLKMLYPGVPFGSTTAIMIAHALMEGVTTLGFFGIDYAHDSEYQDQRANAERWLGIAEGRGVKIIIPTVSPFGHEPREDYAYESHATPEKYAAVKAKFEAAKAKAQAGRKQFNAAQLVQRTAGEDDLAILRAKNPAMAAELAKLVEDQPTPDWLIERELAEAHASHEERRARAKQIKETLTEVDDLTGKPWVDPTLPPPPPPGASGPPPALATPEQAAAEFVRRGTPTAAKKPARTPARTKRPAKRRR